MADYSDDSLAHLLHLHGDELADWLLRPALYGLHWCQPLHRHRSLGGGGGILRPQPGGA